MAHHTRASCLSRNAAKTTAYHFVRRAVPIVLPLLAVASCKGATRPETATDGRVVWKTLGVGGSVTPSHDSSRVFFGSMDHRVVALDRETGRQLWEASTDMGPGGATAGPNTLVVGDVVVLADANIYAFDRVTGQPRWAFKSSGFDAPGGDRLAADSATIYASSFDGRVYAIDATSGTSRWVTQLPGDSLHRSTRDPLVSDGVVYVGTVIDTHPLTGGLTALDAATGEILWIHDFAPRSPEFDSYCPSHPVATESLVIASAADGRIYGLDRATGETRWVAPQVEGYVYDDLRWLELAGSTVIATSMSGTVMGIDAATGSVKWSTYITGVSLLGDIATDGDLAVIAPGEVVTLDVDTGEILWRTGEGREEARYLGQPSIDGSRIYASREDGFVALRAH